MPQFDYDYNYLARYERSRKYNNLKTKYDGDVDYDNRDKKYKRTSSKTKAQMRKFMNDDDDFVVRRSNLATAKKERKKTFDYDSKEKSYFEIEREYRNERIAKRLFNYEAERKTYNKFAKNKTAKVELNAVEAVVEEEKKAKKAARHEAIRNIKNTFLFLLGAAFALFICYRYSIINEKFNAVEKAKKELQNAQTINDQIEAEIDGELDISYIENYAKYQLGMQKPQDSQIIYVNQDKQDKIYRPMENNQGEEKNWIDEFLEKIANIF